MRKKRRGRKSHNRHGKVVIYSYRRAFDTLLDLFDARGARPVMAG